MDNIKVMVDGQELTLEQLEELKLNPKKRLKKLTEGVYKTLIKLEE